MRTLTFATNGDASRFSGPRPNGTASISASSAGGSRGRDIRSYVGIYLEQRATELKRALRASEAP